MRSQEFPMDSVGGIMAPFRILHLSSLHRYSVPILLQYLEVKNFLDIQALVVSGFCERIVRSEIEVSARNLNSLAYELGLEAHQIICLVEPTDCKFPLSIFSNLLYFPIFGRHYYGFDSQMITQGIYQVLGIADHLVPGYPGISQEMLEIKIQQADHRKARLRLFFCGNDPANWKVYPQIWDSGLSHFPVILHGNGRQVGLRDFYFGIGANFESFNILELDGLIIRCHQF